VINRSRPGRSVGQNSTLISAIGHRPSAVRTRDLVWKQLLKLIDTRLCVERPEADPLSDRQLETRDFVELSLDPSSQKRDHQCHQTRHPRSHFTISDDAGLEIGTIDRSHRKPASGKRRRQPWGSRMAGKCGEYVSRARVNCFSPSRTVTGTLTRFRQWRAAGQQTRRTRSLADLSPLSQIPLKAWRHRAHHKGFALVRPFT
jgi:hypothetical protein